MAGVIGFNLYSFFVAVELNTRSRLRFVLQLVFSHLTLDAQAVFSDGRTVKPIFDTSFAKRPLLQPLVGRARA